MMSRSVKALQEPKKGLAEDLAIKDNGELSFYIRCHLEKRWFNRHLKMDQHVYLWTIWDRFGVTNTDIFKPGIQPIIAE